MNILFLGSFPPPLGGVSVSVKQLSDALSEREKINLAPINLAEYNAKSLRRFVRLLSLIQRILKDGRKADVICFHIGISALPWFGPIAVCIARFLNKPLIFRIIGGQLIQQLPWVRSVLSLWTVRRCDLYLVETEKSLAACNADETIRAKLYPAVRPVFHPIEEPAQSSAPFRFVFIGQMKRKKGLGDIKDAIKQLPAGSVIVDCYGPLEFDLEESFFDGVPGFNYMGVLEPSQVLETLIKYTVLLMPTSFQREGRPGVIIEAYNAGLPVIATQCGGIPEIVNEECGILIPPDDSTQLAQAMKLFIDNPNYTDRFKDGVARMRQQYDFDVWVERFVQYCQQAIEARVK